jgi:two-component system sensor histidine kinase PilS (NtrC family)
MALGMNLSPVGSGVYRTGQLNMRETTSITDGSLLYEVIARMSAGLVVLDLTGRIEYANSAARVLLSLAPDFLGANLIETLPQLRPFLSDVLTLREGYVSFEQPSGARLDLFVTVERPGSGDHIALTLSDGSGRSKTEVRRLRDQQLSGAEKMAAKLSHEIKNPLAAILAGLQTLEGGANLSSDDRFVLQLILDEVRSIDRIINGLSAGARREIGPCRSITVEGLLQSALEAVRQASLKKEVSLQLVNGPEGLWILAGEKALTRALENLLSNALEASQSGGHIVLGWRELAGGEKKAVLPGFPGRALGVYGEDCGKGLPEDLSISSIFKPFVSGKATSIGLGLSIAQDIVERHGGVISLKPGSSGGARFEILLPLGPCGARGYASRLDGETSDPCPRRSADSSEDSQSAAIRQERASCATELNDCMTCSNFGSYSLLPFYSGRTGKD